MGTYKTNEMFIAEIESLKLHNADRKLKKVDDVLNEINRNKQG